MEQTAALIVHYRAAVFIAAKDLSGSPLIMPRRLKVQSGLASRFGDYYDGLSVLFILIPLKTVGLVFRVQSLFELWVLRQFKKGLVLQAIYTDFKLSAKFCRSDSENE